MPDNGPQFPSLNLNSKVCYNHYLPKISSFAFFLAKGNLSTKQPSTLENKTLSPEINSVHCIYIFSMAVNTVDFAISSTTTLRISDVHVFKDYGSGRNLLDRYLVVLWRILYASSASLDSTLNLLEVDRHKWSRSIWTACAQISPGRRILP